MNDAIKTILKVVFFPLFFAWYVFLYAIILLLLSFLVAPAWNYSMTYIFGLPEIGYWHAFCLLFVLTTLWKFSVIPIILNFKTIEEEK